MSVELGLYGLTKRYREVVAVDDLTLEVARGEFVALLGPSGCGKTTTLRAIAGFVEVDAGRIVLHGRDITADPPDRRNTGLVFQNYALFPHMTVAQNVAFGLEMRGTPSRERAARVEEVLARVQLAGYGGRYPRQLSGGQQQRVALARALVIRPDLLLLDEPLSNLDAKLRQEMRTEIRELVKLSGATAVYVTHDQEEALSMADRLVVMNAGRLVQAGTPRELFERPAERFVAGFIGAANLWPGRVVSVDGDRAVLDVGALCLAGHAAPGTLAAGQPAVAVLRPEHVQVQTPASDGDRSGAPATVLSASYGGSTSRYRLALPDGTVLQAHILEGMAPLAVGAVARLTWPAERVWIMPDDPIHHAGGVPT